MDGTLPIHMAVTWGLTDIIDLLLSRSAGVNIATARKWTPLMFAIKAGDPKIVEKLLDHKADARQKQGAVFALTPS